MTSREARIKTVELLYETEFHSDNSLSAVEERVKIREEKINGFVRKIYGYYSENQEEIDNTISSSLTNWKLSRIAPIARAILRLCTVELMYTDVPPKVALNEAVDICKQYLDEGSVSFVNGALNQIVHKLGKLDD